MVFNGVKTLFVVKYINLVMFGMPNSEHNIGVRIYQQLWGGAGSTNCSP